MAGKDQKPGRTASPRASNVVHLRPRQWLESEDELVPIGERPTEPVGVGDLGHASTWLGTDEEIVPIAQEPIADTASWAASDFWGEDAAHVHDALEAPVPAPSHQQLSEPRRARPANPRRLLRPPALAAITTAAAAVIVAAISGFGSAPAAPHTSALASSLEVNTSTRSAATAAALTAERLHSTGAASGHRTTDRSRTRARTGFTPARSRTHQQHRRSTATVTGTAAAVRYVAPATDRAPAPTTYRSVTPTEVTSAGSPTHAGPTGTVSLIGPGTSPSG